jgi:hypothetical protein
MTPRNVLVLGLVLSAILGIVIYDHAVLLHQARPPEAPLPALATAAKAYHDLFPLGFRQIEERVKNGTFKSRDDVLNYAATRSKPMRDALNDACDQMCDKDGNIVDPGRGALIFGQTADYLGAK